MPCPSSHSGHSRTRRRLLRPLLVAAVGWLAVVGWAGSSAAAALDPATLIRLSTSVLMVEVIRAQGGYSIGSGVVVSADRVVTNCHVTRDASQISVLQAGVRLAASAQQIDIYHDLCLLHVRGIDASRAVTLARTGELSTGQAVTAVGHTAGALQSSIGNVLALHRMDGASVIQSSNYFNSGASGGGLFDTESRLVGILSFRLRGGEAHYFSVPAAWAALQLKGDSPRERIGPLGHDRLTFWEQPAATQPSFLRAAALEATHDWRALQALASEWARRQADDPEPWYLLGLAFARQDMPADARVALDCSLALAPDFKDALIERQHIDAAAAQPQPASQASSVACRH